MRTLISTLKANARMALVICLWFLLASTGSLLGLHRIMALSGPAANNLPLLALGYLTQAAGIGAFQSQRVVAFMLCLYVLALAGIEVSGNLAFAFTTSLLANVLAGTFQGYYLMLLASRVHRGSRGTVFGCGYAASTFLTLLMSLPADGALASGAPCLGCCALLAAAVLYLLGLKGGPLSARKSAESPGVHAALGKTAPDRKGLLLVGSAIVVACFVHSIGFSFPANALNAHVNLELSRLLYGFGLAVIGRAADYDRRFALVACATSLVMPFLMLSLSGTDAASALLWSLGYLLTGAYVLFNVLIATDLAESTGRCDQAGGGMMAGYVGDAAGASLCFALSGTPTALIALACTGFALAVVLSILLYLPVSAKQPAIVSDEQRSKDLLDLFAARHALTLREREVPALVIAGKSNAEIAAELVVSERTVKFHMTNLLKKTGCKTRLDVIAQFAELKSSPESTHRFLRTLP